MSIEAKKLANALNEILESFEKDGKFCKSSLIRNEFYDRLKQTLEQSKEAIKQAEQNDKFIQACIRHVDELGKYAPQSVADDERLLIEAVEAKLMEKNA